MMRNGSLTERWLLRASAARNVAGRVSAAAVVGALSFTSLSTSAHADYAQTWGMSTKCLGKAGACVADKGDFAAFYHNPAAAADFERTVVGGNVFFLDVRPLEFTDSLGTHQPDATSIEGDIAGVPAFAIYTPIASNAVIGLGLGAPAGVIADWADTGISRFDSLDQSLASFTASPTLAWKPYNWLDVGAAVNVAFAHQLGLHVGIPNIFAPPVTATSPLIGTLGLESYEDVSFPGLPPGSLDFGLHGVSLTMGAKAQVNDRLAVGIVGRTKTAEEWQGNVTVDLSAAGLGVQNSSFRTNIDTPAYVQVGLTYELVPSLLDVSFDFQRTFWSDTNGFGQPLVVNLGTPVAIGAVAGINQLSVSYDAQDANTYRFGAVLHATNRIDLRAGYAFDEKVFPNSTGDLITFDSNRHIFTVGATYDERRSAADAGWEFDAAFQVTHYQSRSIAAGESANLGGLSAPTLTPNATGLTLGFGPNFEAAGFGGDIITFATGLTYHY